MSMAEIPLGDGAKDRWAFLTAKNIQSLRAVWGKRRFWIAKTGSVLHSAVYYPTPTTVFLKQMQVDGDPFGCIKCFHRSISPSLPGTGQIIIVMRIVDQGITDDKVIAVAICASVNCTISRMWRTISPHRTWIHAFFETYTFLEHKKVTTKKFESRVEGWKYWLKASLL